MAEDVVRHVGFQHHGFNIGQAVGVLEVPALHFSGALIAGRQFLDLRLDLLWRGLKLVGIDQLGQHQAQTYAALGIGAEKVFRQINLVGILDATGFQVGAGVFAHAGHFGLHAGLGHVKFGFGRDRIQRGLLVAGGHAEFDFALQVLAHIGAQALNGGVGHAQRFDEGFIQLGQMGGFNVLERDKKVSRFARHFLAVIVFGERERESLAFSRFHAAHGIFKLFEHLAFAKDEDEVIGLAAFKRLAVELAGKVDSDAVAFFSRAAFGALRECAALLAKNVDGAVNGVFADLGRQFLDLNGRQIAQVDFGKNLEHGIENQLAFRRVAFFSDGGLARHAQLGISGFLEKSLANLVIDHFVLHGIAIALGNDVQRDFARAEAIHAHRAGEFAQAGFDFAADGVRRQGERHFALQLFKGFDVGSHICSGLQR